MRKAEIFMHNISAGILIQDDAGYHFKYNENYLSNPEAMAISLTLPLQKNEYSSNVLFPFFDGLIPEGWLLNVAEKNWKLNTRDRMGLLLACCKDCIGAVRIIPINVETV